MIGKLWSAVAVLAVATLLASGGFVGYLFGVGRLNAARVQKIAAVLRGEADTPTPAKSAEGQTPVAGAESAATQPARPAGEEVQARSEREELVSLRLERAQADLEAQRHLLDQMLQHVVQEQERLKEERTAFTAQQKKLTHAALDEGFQKELEYVSGLKPAQALVNFLLLGNQLGDV